MCRFVYSFSLVIHLKGVGGILGNSGYIYFFQSIWERSKNIREKIVDMVNGENDNALPDPYQ